MNKNISLLINLVLIVAIVPLYLLHFSGDETKEGTKDPESDEGDKEEEADQSSETPSSGNFRVAYVNWDSLMNDYAYVEDMFSELEKESIQMRKQLENRMKKLQQEYKQLQEESAYMTQKELEEAQTRMQQKQQELQQRQQNLQSRLAQKEQKMTKRFFDNVNAFLERYNEEKDYDVILRYQRGGELLFAEEAYDITPEVLEGLNENYKEEGANKELPEVEEDEEGENPLAP